MKLLIVEDSALMRRVLRENFADQDDLDLAFARDGEDALEKLESFEPDVITLDINMPKMDGLTCLAHIMERRPCPVIMLSSLTDKGAVATFEALELGAVDFVAKPDGTVSVNLESVMGELKRKIRSAASGRTARASRPTRRTRTPASRPRAIAPAAVTRRKVTRTYVPDLLLIGSSTGGPGSLQTLLEGIPAEFPAPILIAQHMPPKFTAAFAKRLNDTCNVEVVEVSETRLLHAGVVYLAAGGCDVVVRKKLNRLVAEPATSDPHFVWHPSVSRMVASALDHVPANRLMGVMLTGMGDDGSDEMAEIHKQGGSTIAESQETAAVFGMPGQLIEKDGASVVLPVHEIAAELCRWTSSLSSARRRQCS
jgi:two-component system chemotaxis response regulator CheB